MSSMTIDLGGDNYLTTGPVCTGIHFGDGSENHFDLDMVGKMSEWLAVAWENVAGEEYKPVLITERGYVADEGAFEPRTAVGDGLAEDGYPPIKKRAAVLPLFGDAIGVPHEEIPEFVDTVERLERDCE